MSKIHNMADKFWNFVIYGERWKSLLFVFLGAFILRAHTLFIDFIHVDVVTSYILAKRDLAGLPFYPNKNWLNHYLMKWSILFFGDSVTSFHLVGIIFILLTMVFIILLAQKIYNLGCGIVAAMLYGFLISSYNTEFTATNGEVLYNLFCMAAFYFTYLVFFEKKFYNLPFIAIGIYAAFMIKTQGIFSLFAILSYVIFVFPIYRGWFKFSPQRYYLFIAFFSIVFIMLLVIDWNWTHFVFYDKLRAKLYPMVSYVANRGFNPFMVIGKLLLRFIHFGLYHSMLWVPGFFALVQFFKDREKTEKEAFLVSVVLTLFISVFAGGARLSVHYFIPVLPPLAILSGRYITLHISQGVFSKRAFLAFTIPVIFFFAWNVKDAYIRNFAPELKQNEGNLAYYFRMVALASHGEYLLPHKSIVPVLEYINHNTPADWTVLSWPMGTEITYYSGRYSAGYSYWLNEGALYAIVQREKGNIDFYQKYQRDFIEDIKRLSPDIFVDVGGTSMIRKVLVYRKKSDPPFYIDLTTAPIIRFGSFATLDDFPDVIRYLNTNYEFKGYFGDGRIWTRKK